jgi:hypothetical protein
MRLYCYFCGKSVSNEVPDDTIVRACLECPECIEAHGETIKKIMEMDAKPAKAMAYQPGEPRLTEDEVREKIAAALSAQHLHIDTREMQIVVGTVCGSLAKPDEWTEREREVLAELQERTGLSEHRMLLQGLRLYQLVQAGTHRLEEIDPALRKAAKPASDKPEGKGGERP